MPLSAYSMFHPLAGRLSAGLRSKASRLPQYMQADALRKDAPWFLGGGVLGAALGDRARKLRPPLPSVEALPGLDAPAVVLPPDGQTGEGA